MRIIRQFHMDLNAPCFSPHPPTPQKEICNTIVSSFFWVLQVVPREIEDNGYAIFFFFFFFGGGGAGGRG